jgi:hypothetical protein
MFNSSWCPIPSLTYNEHTYGVCFPVTSGEMFEKLQKVWSSGCEKERAPLQLLFPSDQ